MTNILLTRHGHVENPHQVFYGPDARLSDQGKRQILTLAQDIKTAGIIPTRLIASPYTRTQESAEILSSILKIQNISSDDRLVEWQVGRWYNKPLAEFYAYTNYAEYPSKELPEDIEPLLSCATRIQHALRDAAAAHPNETILIVSHREPMASALLRYQNKNWDTIHELHFPVASSWELKFEESTTPSHIDLRFDRSKLE
jgi:broad specificity phosphatase PhoE